MTVLTGALHRQACCTHGAVTAAGAVGGAVALIAILALLAWCYVRRRKRGLSLQRLPSDGKEAEQGREAPLRNKPFDSYHSSLALSEKQMPPQHSDTYAAPSGGGSGRPPRGSTGGYSGADSGGTANKTPTSWRGACMTLAHTAAFEHTMPTYPPIVLRTM